MATYGLSVSVGSGDDARHLGQLNLNFPPRGLWGWGFTSPYISWNDSGKFIVGHAIGKSPVDTYYLDDAGNQRFFISSFIPVYEKYSIGAVRTGRVLYSGIALASDDLTFTVIEVDGKTG